MKRILFLLIVTFLASSCYVTKYTHQEVMDEMVIGQTKEEVIKAVGIADERRTEGHYEEWIYYGNQRSVTYNRPGYTNATVRVNPGINTANVNSRTYGGKSVTRDATSYIKLTFYDGVVTKWDSQGVDLSEKEYSSRGTTLAWLVGIATVILTIILANNTPI